MKPDTALIAAALRRSGGRKNENLAELILTYETACRLASGPDQKRSAYWLAKANASKLDLERRAGFSRKTCEGK